MVLLIDISLIVLMQITTKVATYNQYFNKSRRQLVFRECEERLFNPKAICHHIATATDINANESNKRIYAVTGKAPTLTTMGDGHREPKVLCGKKDDYCNTFVKCV